MDDAEHNDLGSPASRAIKLMNQLREIGIEGDLSIPRIAFAGKQSAGKSSVVEALTGVQLPRNHGTCTRCPIQVTTTNKANADWKCHISLRFEYDDETMVSLDF
jgi:Dynamin family